jgi:uncharacterized protein (TIGR03083 family)
VTTTSTPGIAERYLLAHTSFDALARTLTDAEWAVPVPCTPGWTARDLLSHVTGVTDDVLAGRMQGAPGEEWTAAQVERNRSVAVTDLLDRWAAQAPGFAEAIEQIREGRPPIDCHSHEHDLRHALARPGNRDSPIITVAAPELARLRGHALTVELADGAVLGADGDSRTGTGAGDGSPVVLRGVTAFDLFRSRLGRRTREQVRSWDWSGDPAAIDAVVADWFIFGPAPRPIVE